MSRSSSTSSADLREVIKTSITDVHCVTCYENQRWFPVVGWGTSRLPTDPPVFANLTCHAPCPGKGDNSFETAFVAANRGSEAGPAYLLNCVLPPGYVWIGYWDVYHHHPKRSDERGWRYATDFDARFRCTQTPACVVRRRAWRRAVQIAPSGPTASTNPSGSSIDTSGRSYGPEAEARELYLEDKQDEMTLAERLRAHRQSLIESGGEWTTANDLEAEEELRAFVRDRRAQLQNSATIRFSSSFSSSNPFQPTGGVSIGCVDSPTRAEEHDPPKLTGAAAAGSWLQGSRTTRRSSLPEVEPSNVPTAVDGATDEETPALTFQHNEPSPKSIHVDTLEPSPVPVVSHFVPDASPLDDNIGPTEETAATNSPNSNNDFYTIFSQFVNNPELDTATK